VMALYFMCFMGGTPLGAPLVGWASEHLGARWGLILGGAVCVVAGLVAAAVLGRGRRVRLETRRTRPWVRLAVGPASVPAPAVRAAEEAVAGRTPGSQTLGS
jgi:MFS family permease